MEKEYGSVKVGLEEVFFYDPKANLPNICKLCDRSDCPVPDKRIVKNCNSFKFVPQEREPDVGINWRVIQGMTMTNQPIAYVSNIACTS